jgi:hypothetical protein
MSCVAGLCGLCVLRGESSCSSRIRVPPRQIRGRPLGVHRLHPAFRITLPGSHALRGNPVDLPELLGR